MVSSSTSWAMPVTEREKVAIKINANQDRGEPWKPGAGMHSPQLVCALIEQLVTNAGGPAGDITIYDCLARHRGSHFPENKGAT